MFGNNAKETSPSIKIMGFKQTGRGGRKGAAALTLAKHGYVRVSADLGKLLNLGEDDYIVFAQFGSQLLVAKKPEGKFGHVALRHKETKSNSASSSWYGNNKEVTEEMGHADYSIGDEVPVDDIDNDIKWVKLSQISE